MGIDIGDLTASINIDTSALRTAQSQINTASNSTIRNFNRVDNSVRHSTRNITNNITNIRNSAQGASNATDNLARNFNLLAVAASAFVAVKSVVSVLNLADNMEMLSARIQGATDSNNDFVRSQKALVATSAETGVSLEALVSTFQGIKLISDEIGMSNNEALKLVDLLNKIGIVGGTSTVNASQAIRQFAQSMSKGVVNGDELTSILENMPLLAQYIARSLNRSTTELKQMGEEGKLIMSEIMPNLLGFADEISDKFAEMPTKMSVGWTALTTQMSLAVGEANTYLGVTKAIAGVLKSYAEDIKTIRGSFGGYNKVYSEKLAESGELMDKEFSHEENIKKNKKKLASATDESYRQTLLGYIAHDEEQMIKTKFKLAEIRQELQSLRDYNIEKNGTTGDEKKDIPKKSRLESMSENEYKRWQKSGQKALDKRAQLNQKQLQDQENLSEQLLKQREKDAENEQRDFERKERDYYKVLDVRRDIYDKEKDLKQQQREQELADEERHEEEKARIGQSALDDRARRFEQQKANEKKGNDLALQALSSFGSQSLDLLKKAGMEQSALYKAMFLLNKGLAVSQIIISAQVQAAQIKKLIPIGGEVQAGIALASGYASAGMVAGMAVAGGRRHGGMAGVNTIHKVGEGDPEMLVQGSQKYLLNNNKGGKITPLSNMNGSQTAQQITVNLIEDKSKAGTVSRSRDGQSIDAYVALIKNAVADDILRGGNNISRALDAQGLQSRGTINV